MVLDVPDLEPSSSEDEEDLNDIGHKANGQASGLNSQSLGRLHIGHMLQSVLQDAQTRLFFKAQTVVQSDIRNYSAKPEDLDYPKVLQGVSFAASVIGQTLILCLCWNTESRKSMQQRGKIIWRKGCCLSSSRRFNRNDVWYPTLKTTVSIYRSYINLCRYAIFHTYRFLRMTIC